MHNTLLGDDCKLVYDVWSLMKNILTGLFFQVKKSATNSPKFLNHDPFRAVYVQERKQWHLVAATRNNSNSKLHNG